MGLKHAGWALVSVICCLLLAACKSGSPSSPQGAPPGQNLPGAPAGNGGGGQGGDGSGNGGGVPVGPYKIPDIVIKAGTVYEDMAKWRELENDFWSACPGGSHCVTPVLILVDAADSLYPACAMTGVQVDGVPITTAGTPVKMGSRIVVSFKRPCPGLEGDGGGGSPGSSEPPPSDAPATGEPNTP